MRLQEALPGIDTFFLSQRLDESRALVREVVAKSTEKPLILQFSGGRDSMAVLGLVKEVTDNFVCAYMATGLEFKGILQFVRQTCKDLGVRLIVSTPGMYKGNIFKRVEKFRRFPSLNTYGGKGGSALWCCRDLKLRPQKILLRTTFGKGAFYKLEGVRRFESWRRRYIYRPYAESMMRPDAEHRGSYETFPILNWTDKDVLNYLEMKGLPTSGLYKEYGVSGCSFCPFYGPKVYLQVLRHLPNHYDRFIRWEEELGMPSVIGHVWLRDLKQQVLTGVAPEPVEVEAKRPCTIKMNGQEFQTCEVYGHIFIDGKCYRCDAEEEG